MTIKDVAEHSGVSVSTVSRVLNEHPDVSKAVREKVLASVHALNKEENITVILITHYMEEVIHADKVYVMDKGRVVMHGSPKQVFSHVEELTEMGLSVPKVTLLARELMKQGIGLPAGIVTAEELVGELCRSLRTI